MGPGASIRRRIQLITCLVSELRCNPSARARAQEEAQEEGEEGALRRRQAQEGPEEVQVPHRPRPSPTGDFQSRFAECSVARTVDSEFLCHIDDLCLSSVWVRRIHRFEPPRRLARRPRRRRRRRASASSSRCRARPPSRRSRASRASRPAARSPRRCGRTSSAPCLR